MIPQNYGKWTVIGWDDLVRNYVPGHIIPPEAHFVPYYHMEHGIYIKKKDIIAMYVQFLSGTTQADIHRLAGRYQYKPQYRIKGKFHDTL